MERRRKNNSFLVTIGTYFNEGDRSVSGGWKRIPGGVGVNGAPSRSPGGSLGSRTVGGAAACGRTDRSPTIPTRVIAGGINVLESPRLDGQGATGFACCSER